MHLCHTKGCFKATALLFGHFPKHTIIELYPRDTKTGDAPRHWRWRGFITDYYTAESVLQENPLAGNPTTASQDGPQASASKQNHTSLPSPPPAPRPPLSSSCSSSIAMLQMLARLVAGA